MMRYVAFNQKNFTIFVMAVGLGLLYAINGVGELWVLCIAVFGLIQFFRSGHNNKTFFSRRDLMLSLVFMSVFLFKLLSSVWAPSAYQAISNAVMHIPLFLWPLLFVAFAIFSLRLSYWRVAMSMLLLITTVWFMLRDFLGLPIIVSPMPHYGVFSQLFVAMGLMVIAPIAAERDPKDIPIFTKLNSFSFFAWLCVWYLISMTGRRTEWIAFVVGSGILLFFFARARLNPTYRFLLLICFLGAFIFSTWMIIPRISLAVHEVLLYAQDIGGQQSANTSVGSRMEFYLRGILAVRENPWLGVGAGVGPGDLQYLVPDHADIGHRRHFHSSYLQVFVEGGLIWGSVSALLVIFAIREMVVKPWATHPEVSLCSLALWLSFALSGLTGEALMYGPTTAFFALATAQLWALIRSPSGAGSAELLRGCVQR